MEPKICRKCQEEMCEMRGCDNIGEYEAWLPSSRDPFTGEVFMQARFHICAKHALEAEKNLGKEFKEGERPEEQGLIK